MDMCWSLCVSVCECVKLFFRVFEYILVHGVFCYFMTGATDEFPSPVGPAL